MSEVFALDVWKENLFGVFNALNTEELTSKLEHRGIEFNQGWTAYHDANRTLGPPNGYLVSECGRSACHFALLSTVRLNQYIVIKISSARQCCVMDIAHFKEYFRGILKCINEFVRRMRTIRLHHHTTKH